MLPFRQPRTSGTVSPRPRQPVALSRQVCAVSPVVLGARPSGRTEGMSFPALALGAPSSVECLSASYAPLPIRLFVFFLLSFEVSLYIRDASVWSDIMFAAFSPDPERVVHPVWGAFAE